MAVPESPLATPNQSNDVQKQQVVATIVASMITVTGRPHSINEVQALMRDVHYALFPRPNQPQYQAWEKTKNAILEKIHA